MKTTTTGKTMTMIVAALLVAWSFAAPTGWAQTPEEKERAELATALKPISAKYEVEHGKLQLSVYTMKGDTFSEVIVDHKTGKVAKAEPITQGDDLTHAKAQSEAMARATRPLDAAASEAVKENAGYRVVSVMPALKDGHPVADVILVKGTDWKTVSEKLD